ncbi:phage baseplate protein [uncultured Tissierella sp.]|uniref:phage baseplate protein n=1 Tax=uncultured Tissierella sp. TaxID=448160 RepID=UPI002803F66B|nr:hypothetical protein [uncultured Tissierella sp.]MDU5080227.1 hypothetical protein [Bacillota bacterium]
MAVYENSPFGQGSIKQLIGCKTNIGGFFFDAYLRLDHTRKTKITQHPVETGAAITDHAYVEPAELIIEVGMSDACISFIQGQFNQKYTRSVSAIDTLWKLQEQRIPMDVLTRLKLYKNMLIEVISVPDDWQTLNGLRATVTLREIIVVGVKTVEMNSKASSSKSPQKTAATNKGTQQVTKPNQSVLKQTTNLLKGG